MKNTGQKLKSAREAQRVSVNEVAMATKISPRLIQAIEDGDVSALPAKTFLRGFVQSYASYLKLDVDDLLEVFHEEMGSTLPDSGHSVQQPDVEEKEEQKSPPLLHDKSIWPKVVGGAVILALVLLIIGVKNTVEKYEKEADTPPAPTDIAKIENPEASEEVSTPDLEVEENQKPPKESGAAVIPDKPTTPDSNKLEETPVPTQPDPKPVKVETPPTPPPAEEKVKTEIAKPTPKPEPKQEKRPEPEPEPETQAESNPEPNTPAESKPKPIPKVKNEIIVEALDVVEIEFRVGNGELKRVTLKPDQIHTIKAFGPVNLDLSDGGAVNLIHNGRDRGVPGDLGKPKKVKIQ